MASRLATAHYLCCHGNASPPSPHTTTIITVHTSIGNQNKAKHMEIITCTSWQYYWHHWLLTLKAFPFWCGDIYIVDKSTRKSFSCYVYPNTTAQTLPPCLVLHPSYEPGVGESPWHNSLTHHHLENSLRLSPLSLYHWLSYQSDVVYLIPRVYYKTLPHTTSTGDRLYISMQAEHTCAGTSWQLIV